MKKRYYLKIAVSATVAVFLLTGCAQNSTEKTSAVPTATVNSPITTNSDAESKINYTDKLKSEGYISQDIKSSESYIRRVMLQLNEIETFGSINIQPAGIGNSSSEDSTKYSELLSKIYEQKAIYYLVKLNSDFNSMEDALNEYLLALQSDFDIENYFIDKKKYNEAKSEKLSGANFGEFITVRDIEEKVLENLQNMNNLNNNSNPSVPGMNNKGTDINSGVINPQPDIPTVEIPKPIDPSREIMDKIGPHY